MADAKKSCCNRGEALDALDWANTNKKIWSVMFRVAKYAPLAVVKAVAELKGVAADKIVRRLSGDVSHEWLCPKCIIYNHPGADICSQCHHERPPL